MSNIGSRKEYFAAYYKKNKKKEHERYLERREKNIESAKKRYKDNRDEILKLHKEKYYKKEENTEYFKGYRKKNRAKVNKYAKEWMFNRRKNDVNSKVKDYLRIRIRAALKGEIKYGKLYDLLGCTLEELKKHLESKFTEGMNWNNYGEWHIDHIIPCKIFDLSKEEAQKICFHYTNLQPLWGIDNIKKGSFVDKNDLINIRVDLLNPIYLNQ